MTDRILVSCQLRKLTGMSQQHMHSIHERGLGLSIPAPVSRGRNRLYSEGDALAMLVYSTLRKNGVASEVAVNAAIRIQKKLGTKMTAGRRLVLFYAKGRIQLSASVKDAFWKLPLRPLIEKVEDFQ